LLYNIKFINYKKWNEKLTNQWVVLQTHNIINKIIKICKPKGI